MYLHWENDKSLGFTFVQAKPVKPVSDRILFPSAFIRFQFEKINLSNPDIKTDRIFVKQPKSDSHGHRNFDANDPAAEVVLHVCTESAGLADWGCPGIVYAVYCGYIETVFAANFEG